LAGCKTQRPSVVQVPVKTLERKVTTLVPVAVPGDSAILRAWFKCDSMNNVLMKGIGEQKSKNMSSGLTFSDGLLEYAAKTQPDTMYLPSDTIYTEKEVPVPVEVEKEINVLTKWQKIRMRIGDFALLILFVFIGWKIIKRYLNFKKL